MKFRRTQSSGSARFFLATVVRVVFWRVTPKIPRARINLATRSRPQEIPSRCNCHQIFAAPYASKFSSHTRRISFFNSASVTDRRDGGRVLLS